MKIISNCEREFIVKCVSNNSRIDGRILLEGRSVEIIFGREWGCCLVHLGSTKVLAQVSAEVTEPKAVSPTEGALHINLEISSMSAPDVQYQSRISDESVGLQRILERCIRDSKCIDLESLCIVAGSKVWTIRLDVHALNDDGNLIECANIAAISALAHFKRPDVTVVGTEVTVHSLDNREPVPLNLHHMPLCINLALFNQGEHIVTDPTASEEKVADGCYLIGINAHQEICLIHRLGVLLLSCDTMQKCEDIAIKRSQVLTQEIRKALEDDAYKRATNTAVGFVYYLQTGTILGTKCPIRKVDFNEIVKQAKGDVSVVADKPISVVPKTFPPIVSQAGLKAKKLLQDAEIAVFEGGESKWKNMDDEESSEEEEIVSVTKEISLKQELELSSEDETVSVTAVQMDVKPSKARTWYSKDPFS